MNVGSVDGTTDELILGAEITGAMLGWYDDDDELYTLGGNDVAFVQEAECEFINEFAWLV